MNIRRIEHIGIAVNNEENASQLFQSLLGKPIYKTEEVASEKVKTHFLRVGESKIELLSSKDDESPITKFLEKRGPGIHHIAFEVEDIHDAHKEVLSMGLEVLNESPKKGADNKLIFFIHPKSTGGVLVEFCQEQK
jgi:methylmalonyl-CoA/ethylmalonyl-CoA epimerase